jgi:ABC-type polysaccharide/polyol phosphate transport system ATPase subunit/glycosyltransferase involved in cell wall biosynthesis
VTDGVTRLHATLGQRLPRRLSVGRGNALFLAGGCHAGDEKLESLSIVANGAELEVIAHGMPPLHTRDRAGTRWWGVLPIPAGSSDSVLRVGLHAHLSDGSDLRAELGEIELAPNEVPTAGAAHGNGGAASSNGGNGHRTWHPKGGPVIAIAMATHRPPVELFRKQIESIRKQTHASWVCVISDDASGEQSLAQMREVLGDDPRFRLHPAEEQQGVYRNFERALELVPAEAEFVALCDQDDEWHPDKLETLRDALGSGAQLAYSDLRIVRANGKEIADTYWTERRNNHTNFASLLIANTVTGGASMFRRDVLDYALPFPQELPEQWHDHWLAIVSMARGEIAYVDRPLYDYVQHGDAALGHQRANQGASSTLAQRMETVKQGGVLEGWGLVYYQHYRRLLLAATVLQLRFGDQLAKDKAKAVHRVLGSDSLRGMTWLSARALRARFGRATETMQRDSNLVRAIAWLRITRGRARRRGERDLIAAADVERLDLPPGAGAPRDRALAVQIDGLYKSFRVPIRANQTLITRLLHPRSDHGHKMLPVLKDISFEIGQGEFFGIIGRNGSGKSTLLKLMASIYRADQGGIRVGGQIVPIIELGLGFHPELAARDNLVVQGVMMGLTRKQSEARFERAMSFAGLQGFESMKLRNYSSGMKVRLAFGIMVEVDGDVMMIDEVLAVGDSAFQRKSRDIFQNYKDRGKTVILVSHQMTAIQELCDRVLLLEGGRIERIGDPYECARRYSELAISGTPTRDEHLSGDVNYPVSLVDIWIGDLQGDTTPLVEESEELRLNAVIETKEPIENATFRFEIRNQNRARIFSPPATDLHDGERIEAGKRVHIEATIENRLTPDVYSLLCVVNRRDEGDNDRALSDAKSIDFAIPGARYRGQGLLSLESNERIEDLGKAGPAPQEEQRGS